ncbi:MAG: hypothetical protein AB7V46_00625 [Thermomicrobiales bacterium]
MTYQSLNLFNGKLVESFDPLGDAPLATKIATAQACFESWRHTRERLAQSAAGSSPHLQDMAADPSEPQPFTDILAAP